MIQRIEQTLLNGVILISPSKSDAQRALLASALCVGTSKLKNVGESKDELAMLQTIQSFGCEVERIGDVLKITPPKSINKIQKINAGESGLGVRLLTSISATMKHLVLIDGEGSLKQREMSFFEQTFPHMEVKFQSKDKRLPFVVQGPMKSGIYTEIGRAHV